VSLPLLKRVADDSVTYVMTPRAGARPDGLRSGVPGVLALNPGQDLGVDDDGSAALALDTRMPTRRPGPGEQYRFHVDMRSCIGCKCCVVACNEQNGNPAAINWRRVGEVEGGWYPNSHRA
jgi:hypothetical protein